MKYVALLLFVCQVSFLTAQHNFAVIPEVSMHVNFFQNKIAFDKTHYSFNRPTTYGIGLKALKKTSENNFILGKLKYMGNKISFNYEINEAEIPYQESSSIYIIYNILQLGIGYQRAIPFTTDKILPYFQFDLNFEHASSVAVGFSTNSTTTNEPLKDTLYFNSRLVTHLGQVANRISITTSLGSYFGSTKKHSLSAFFNLPFGALQRKTVRNTYEWEYKNKTYQHQLNFKGNVLTGGITYGFKIYNK